MEPWLQTVVTIIASVIASSGFWAYVQYRLDKKDNRTKLLMGLAHDRIMYLGICYLDRGDWITQDEYENLYNYLYKPYEAEGGNGSAERTMKEVDRRLRIVKHKPIFKEEEPND